MSIYEAYWREFVDVKIAEQYFSLYENHSQRCLWMINALCMIFSFTGVISWATSTLPAFWSVPIVLGSQIISVLQPLYPYSERLYAAKCIHKEYATLSLAAEQIVNGYLYGGMEEACLLNALERAQNESHDIESKFCSASLFPQKKKLHQQAEMNVLQYLTVHFNLGA